MSQKTAIVFGGTGLIGGKVIEELLNSPEYARILVFTRQKIDIPEKDKVVNHIVDFEKIESFKNQITGDDLFICLGTTIKKAGSVSKMEETDRDLPVSLADAALKNGTKRIAVVSSIGANEKSSNYYLRIKGEMEKSIYPMDFISVSILRPSLLLGDRKEKRTGESVSKIFMKIFGKLLFGSLRKFRAIEAKDVAKAMIWIINNNTGKEIYESDKIQEIALKK